MLQKTELKAAFTKEVSHDHMYVLLPFTLYRYGKYVYFIIYS